MMNGGTRKCKDEERALELLVRRAKKMREGAICSVRQVQVQGLSEPE